MASVFLFTVIFGYIFYRCLKVIINTIRNKPKKKHPIVKLILLTIFTISGAYSTIILYQCVLIIGYWLFFS